MSSVYREIVSPRASKRMFGNPGLARFTCWKYTFMVRSQTKDLAFKSTERVWNSQIEVTSYTFQTSSMLAIFGQNFSLNANGLTTCRISATRWLRYRIEACCRSTFPFLTAKVHQLVRLHRNRALKGTCKTSYPCQITIWTSTRSASPNRWASTKSPIAFTRCSFTPNADTSRK